MKVWRLVNAGHTIEVWDVDDQTGELGKVSKLDFQKSISRPEAQTWMTQHYPVLRPSDGTTGS